MDCVDASEVSSAIVTHLARPDVRTADDLARRLRSFVRERAGRVFKPSVVDLAHAAADEFHADRPSGSPQRAANARLIARELVESLLDDQRLLNLPLEAHQVEVAAARQLLDDQWPADPSAWDEGSPSEPDSWRDYDGPLLRRVRGVSLLRPFEARDGDSWSNDGGLACYGYAVLLTVPSATGSDDTSLHSPPQHDNRAAGASGDGPSDDLCSSGDGEGEAGENPDRADHVNVAIPAAPRRAEMVSPGGASTVRAALEPFEASVVEVLQADSLDPADEHFVQLSLQQLRLWYQQGDRASPQVLTAHIAGIAKLLSGAAPVDSLTAQMEELGLDAPTASAVAGMIKHSWALAQNELDAEDPVPAGRAISELASDSETAVAVLNDARVESGSRLRVMLDRSASDVATGAGEAMGARLLGYLLRLVDPEHKARLALLMAWRSLRSILLD